MFVHDKSDVLLLCGAFHRAWVTLLLNEKLDANKHRRDAALAAKRDPGCGYTGQPQ
jgi:hypothetical protein